MMGINQNVVFFVKFTYSSILNKVTLFILMACEDIRTGSVLIPGAVENPFVII